MDTIENQKLVFNKVQRVAAVTAGISLFIMAILAPFANFYVLGNLIVDNDISQTVQNIANSHGVYRLGILSFILVGILDIIAAMSLYIVFRPISEWLSLLSMCFRLVYSAMLLCAIGSLFNVLGFLSESGMQNQIISSINGFNNLWDIGLMIFGIHLLVLGYLILKASYLKGFLGIFVSLAGLGYVIDAVGQVALQNYNLEISGFTFIGEVLLMIWLLWFGFRRNKQC